MRTAESTLVPERLGQIAIRAGSIKQPAIPFRADRWIEKLPAFEETFRALPDRLDRPSVRTFCDGQPRDGVGLVSTFIASQVWGYGNRGYGWHRLAQALEHPDLVPALQCAADELDDGEPVNAFEALCIVFDLPEVGTAFGSKYLFFADRKERALILDNWVGKWLRANMGRRFNLDSHVGDYRLWLNLASRWARELDLTPEQVELLIFTDGLPSNSQWRS